MAGSFEGKSDPALCLHVYELGGAKIVSDIKCNK